MSFHVVALPQTASNLGVGDLHIQREWGVVPITRVQATGWAEKALAVGFIAVAGYAVHRLTRDDR